MQTIMSSKLLCDKEYTSMCSNGSSGDRIYTYNDQAKF